MGNEQKGKGKSSAPTMPTTNEIKTYIMIIQNKFTLFRNKKIASIKQKKKEIAKCLKENNLDVAKAKMDSIIREEDMITVYDILGPLCEILKERVTYIISNSECPPDLRAQLDSVIYASTRLEFEELHRFRDMIMRRYGQNYVMKADSNADKLVNVNLVEKLRIKPASDVFVTIRLKQLCKEFKIPFEFPMEVENDVPIDPMNAQNPYGGPGLNPFDNQPNNFGPPQNMNNNSNPYGPPQDNSNPYGPPPNMNNNNNPYGPPPDNSNPYGPPSNMNNNNNPYGLPPDNNSNPYGPPSNMNNNNSNPYGPPSDNSNPYGNPSNMNNNPYDKPQNDSNPYGSSQEGNPFGNSSQAANPYGPSQGGNSFDNNQNQGGNPYNSPPSGNQFDNKPFDQNNNVQFSGMSDNDNLDCKYTSLRNRPKKKGDNPNESKLDNSKVSQVKEPDNSIKEESPATGESIINNNPNSSQLNESKPDNNPYGGETNDNPFANENNKNEGPSSSEMNSNPYGGETNDNPFANENNKNEGPSSGETNDNPFANENNKNDNPYGGETNDNPFVSESDKKDNPFGGETNDNPYGEKSNLDNPFGNSMSNSVNNPYGGETKEDENNKKADDDFPKFE